MSTQLLICKFAVFTCVSFFFTDASHGSLPRSLSRPPAVCHFAFCSSPVLEALPKGFKLIPGLLHCWFFFWQYPVLLRSLSDIPNAFQIWSKLAGYKEFTKGFEINSNGELLGMNNNAKIITINSWLVHDLRCARSQVRSLVTSHPCFNFSPFCVALRWVKWVHHWSQVYQLDYCHLLLT